MAKKAGCLEQQEGWGLPPRDSGTAHLLSFHNHCGQHQLKHNTVSWLSLTDLCLTPPLPCVHDTDFMWSRHPLHQRQKCTLPVYLSC